VGQGLVHEHGADLLYLRHVFLLTAGLFRRVGAQDVRVFGRSAGTHSALALNAHWRELNAELAVLTGPFAPPTGGSATVPGRPGGTEGAATGVFPKEELADAARSDASNGDFLEPDADSPHSAPFPPPPGLATGGADRALPLRLNLERLVLCGGAAPHAYWTAPKEAGCKYVLIQAAGDRLCSLDISTAEADHSAFTGFTLVPVTVPHPRLASHLLGSRCHGYMHLCVTPDTSGDLKGLPQAYLISDASAQHLSPGNVLDRLNRLGMAERLQRALPDKGYHPARRGWAGDRLAALRQSFAAALDLAARDKGDLLTFSKELAKVVAMSPATPSLATPRSCSSRTRVRPRRMASGTSRTLSLWLRRGSRGPSEPTGLRSPSPGRSAHGPPPPSLRHLLEAPRLSAGRLVKLQTVHCPASSS